MSLAPIVLFVYNRPVHTLQVLAALALNKAARHSELYIFSDGPKEDADEEARAKIASVREVIRQRKWCKNVHIVERPSNLGISKSVILGIATVLKEHPRVIVLEDDIVPSPVFLAFMNEALDLYEQNEDVISISSYNFFALSASIPDVFFSQLIDCWGWATWRRGWALFEPNAGKLIKEIDRLDGRVRFNVNDAYDYYGMLEKNERHLVDAWDIRWYASGFIHNKLSLYPKASLSKNIGFDGSGVNSGHHEYADGQLTWPTKYPSLKGLNVENNIGVLGEFFDYFQRQRGKRFKYSLDRFLKMFSISGNAGTPVVADSPLEENGNGVVPRFRQSTKSPAPIVLFVYNRPDHARQVLEALALNTLAHQSELFIFSDGPKEGAGPEALEKISAVRSLIREQKWCGTVHLIEQETNLGLARSVVSGISTVLASHSTVIVLEDDIVPSPVFLSFMNDALELYENEEEVISISSYNFFARSGRIPDVFFSQLIDCWGWATWRRGWDLFEPDAGKLISEIDRQNARSTFNVQEAYDYYNLLERTRRREIDSWAIRWYASGFIHRKLSVYPKVSMSRNIGFDGTGINSGHHVYTDGHGELPRRYPSLAGRNIANNQYALEEFYDYFHPRQKSPLSWLSKLFR